MEIIEFAKRDTEKFKKRDLIKYIILALATPMGLVLSGTLAYLNINFTELLNLFVKNFSNSEVLNDAAQIMRKWYLISGVLTVGAVILTFVYLLIKGKKDEEGIFTWRQTIFLASELILISQVVLPLFSVIIALVMALLYFVIFSSMLLKTIIEYGTYLFVILIEKICAISGITLEYGEFIGHEKYSIFLTMITALILIPYLLSFLLRMMIKFFQVVTGDKVVALVFKPIEAIISINVLRYSIYILLFFTSVFTYSVSVSQSDYVLSIVKEALLEFVLLDTVIYSLISNMKDAKAKRKLQNTRRSYISFKYDLEFVLMSISMYNLKNKEINARIVFSSDMSRILKKRKATNEIDKLLIDISKNFYEIEILEQKIKRALSGVIDLLG